MRRQGRQADLGEKNTKARFERWQPEVAILPDLFWRAPRDFLPFDDKLERARLPARVDIAPVALTSGEVTALVALLGALTGTRSLYPRFPRPRAVASGLEVD